MSRLQIATNLSASGALAHGSTEHGYLLVAPTSEQIQALPEEQRAQLAQYVAPEHGDARADLRVHQPGWPGVVDALVQAAERHASEAAERARKIAGEKEQLRSHIAVGRYYELGSMPPVLADYHWPPNYSKGDPEAEQLWQQLEAAKAAQRDQMIREADAVLSYDLVNGELSSQIRAVRSAAGNAATLAPRAQSFVQRLVAEQVAAAKAKEAAKEAAYAALVAEHGSPDQLERLEAGVLPEPELTELVERVVFAPLDSCAEYDEISEQEVAQECECALDAVRFSSRNADAPKLTAEQFSRFKAIRAASPADATISVREHIGYAKHMSGADDPEVSRLGVRVTIEFAGSRHSREYAI